MLQISVKIVRIARESENGVLHTRSIKERKEQRALYNASPRGVQCKPVDRIIGLRARNRTGCVVSGWERRGG